MLDEYKKYNDKPKNRQDESIDWRLKKTFQI